MARSEGLDYEAATLALTAAGRLAEKALEVAGRGRLVAQSRGFAVCRPRAGTDRRGRSVVTTAMPRTALGRSPWPFAAPGCSPGPPGCLELLLIEVLRLHLVTAPAVERGWVAALRDPVLASAMASLHAAPRNWTVADLAAEDAVSRSVLDSRFRQVLGRSPIRYLAEWRMHVAQELLATTELGVAAIARRVGYDSEEAFSRAFKRTHSCAPSHWCATRSRKPNVVAFGWRQVGCA